MKKITTTFVASFAMLALACPLYAADDNKMTTETKQQVGTSQYQEGQRAGTSQSNPTQMTGASRTMSDENIKGFNVFSQSGEKIGEITDVRTDKQSGKVQFVTLTKGGIMGIGGKDTAIPLGALKIDRQNERANLTVSEDMLNNGPTQAGKSDQDFQRELSSHYGIAPVWEEKSRAGGSQVPDPSPGLETGSPQSQGGRSK